MAYIVLGGFGLLMTHFFDVVALKRVPWAKAGTWIVGSGLLVYSLTMLSLKSDALPLPVWSTWLGWGFFPVSLFLLVYSLFVNLPFRETYIANGVGNKLVTSGLYTLVRHPWVHWFTLILLSLVLVTKSSLLLIAAPIFILLNILLVIIQDKFLFSKMFHGYDSYRQETPMFLPSRKSLNAFISYLRQSRAK